VPLSFNGEQFASPVTDEEGAFSITFTVPADIAPGVVTFTALCGAFTLTTELTVVPPGTVTTPTTLAGGGSLTPTGSNSTQLFQVAGALLAVGALLVFLARRQSRRRTPVVSV
jgi:LPXTG-motif cell wall-anchored protein